MAAKGFWHCACLVAILTSAGAVHGQGCSTGCDACLNGMDTCAGLGQSCTAGCDGCLFGCERCTGTGHGCGAGGDGCLFGSDGCNDFGQSCCAGGCDRCLFGRILKPSDHCFDDFISPMSNFIFFEDPRTLTEARAIFFHHELPDQIAPGIPGGRVQLYALQLRFALTERLSVIAVKDGFIVTDINPGPLDDLLDDGWAAVTAGLKYNLVRNVNSGTLLSTGLTYEIPVGSQRTLQDIGDGEFHVFFTGGQRLFDGLGHYLGAFGVRLPVDGGVQTSSIHWSNHLDVKLTDRIYAFSEFVWWHWTDSANNGAALGVAGQDAFNLFSTNVAGNDLVTQSVGAKFKPSGNVELGVAYEFPLTGFHDIIDSRIQAELILRY